MYDSDDFTGKFVQHITRKINNGVIKIPDNIVDFNSTPNSLVAFTPGP